MIGTISTVSIHKGFFFSKLDFVFFFKLGKDPEEMLENAGWTQSRVLRTQARFGRDVHKAWREHVGGNMWEAEEWVDMMETSHLRRKLDSFWLVPGEIGSWPGRSGWGCHCTLMWK